MPSIFISKHLSTRVFNMHVWPETCWTSPIDIDWFCIYFPFSSVACLCARFTTTNGECRRVFVGSDILKLSNNLSYWRRFAYSIQKNSCYLLSILHFNTTTAWNPKICYFRLWNYVQRKPLKRVNYVFKKLSLIENQIESNQNDTITTYVLLIHTNRYDYEFRDRLILCLLRIDESTTLTA